jgi:hypothetical protein
VRVVPELTFFFPGIRNSSVQWNFVWYELMKTLINLKFRITPFKNFLIHLLGIKFLRPFCFFTFWAIISSLYSTLVLKWGKYNWIKTHLAMMSCRLLLQRKGIAKLLWAELPG